MGIAYNTSIVTDGLVYALDAANSRSYAGSGNTVYDVISSAGSNINSVSYSTSNYGTFSFSGSNINSGALAVLRTAISNYSYLTLSMWIKRTRFSHTTLEGLFAMQKSNGVHSILIYIGTDNLLNFGGRSSGDASFLNVTSTSAINNTNFYHLTCIYDLVGKANKMYINGVQETTTGTANWASTTFGLGGGSAENRIGDEITAGVSPFYGNIPQVQVYSRALSAQEVLQNYNATKKRYI
jgi:hypothetical protein